LTLVIYVLLFLSGCLFSDMFLSGVAEGFLPAALPVAWRGTSA
jgi:hypothetical protein